MGNVLFPPAWDWVVHSDRDQWLSVFCVTIRSWQGAVSRGCEVFLFLKIIFVFLENSRKNMGIPFPRLFFFPSPASRRLVSKYARCGYTQRKPSYRFYGSKLIDWLSISNGIQSVLEAKLIFQSFGFVSRRVWWGRRSLLILSL